MDAWVWIVVAVVVAASSFVGWRLGPLHLDARAHRAPRPARWARWSA